MNPFETNRNHIYSLEYIKGEMYVKITELEIKKPDMDLTEARNKMKLIEEVQLYLNEMYEEAEEMRKTIQRKELEIKGLQALLNKK